jgi:hypothetical protein
VTHAAEVFVLDPSPTEKDFRREFDREIMALLTALIADVRKSHDDPEKIAAIAKEFASRHPPLFARIERLRSHYVTRYRMWERLADERRQTSRAITIDHIKLFTSRLVYAVMIAAVVLATGHVAKLYEIPLPLLRGVL